MVRKKDYICKIGCLPISYKPYWLIWTKFCMIIPQDPARNTVVHKVYLSHVCIIVMKLTEAREYFSVHATNKCDYILDSKSHKPHLYIILLRLPLIIFQVTPITHRCASYSRKLYFTPGVFYRLRNKEACRHAQMAWRNSPCPIPPRWYALYPPKKRRGSDVAAASGRRRVWTFRACGLLVDAISPFVYNPRLICRPHATIRNFGASASML